MGKAEIYGHPSLLLFGQPVGIHAGESLYKSSLTMIHMSRCSDNMIHLLTLYGFEHPMNMRNVFVFQCSYVQVDPFVVYCSDNWRRGISQFRKQPIRGLGTFKNHSERGKSLIWCRASASRIGTLCKREQTSIESIEQHLTFLF